MKTVENHQTGPDQSHLVQDAAEPRKPAHYFGFLAGQIQIPDDFDTMFAEEIEAVFNGEP